MIVKQKAHKMLFLKKKKKQSCAWLICVTFLLTFLSIVDAIQYRLALLIAMHHISACIKSWDQ